jgi:hypothetical protein
VIALGGGKSGEPKGKPEWSGKSSSSSSDGGGNCNQKFAAFALNCTNKSEGQEQFNEGSPRMEYIGGGGGSLANQQNQNNSQQNGNNSGTENENSNVIVLASKESKDCARTVRRL